MLKNFKNTISSKTIGFLSLLLILLEGLFLFSIDLPYLNTIRYIVLGVFLILVLYFLLDYTVDKKVAKASIITNGIINHLTKENKRLYAIQLDDLDRYKKGLKETMTNKLTTDVKNETKTN